MKDLILHTVGTVAAAAAAVVIIKARPNDTRWLIYKKTDKCADFSEGKN
jgi:hypothetical protein